ncbi:peptide chain release factor N(5)-glutamine methyltransferase [Luteimonas dalianensis]|uniref:peptide chain release factor N(5)-glutamine methyltransferase n=1 Tax=Luteimonas dalianensis TaxID=1148196 RepID=UPI003BEFDF60
MNQVPPTSDALLRQARARIAPHEASLLLAHVLGQAPAWLYAHGGDVLAEADVRRFYALVERRVAGEPVAYLTGRRGFWTLDLAVNRDTLIPRPETERLVELALERVPAGAPVRLLDMGTGSGAIALALASERPGAQVTATDCSAGALEVARRNALDHGIANVRFVQGDWYRPVAGMRFDLIASNPPYIAGGDVHLERGDLRFEPAGALSPGGDGLDALRMIAAGAPEHLSPGGWLLVEHGLEQGAAVRALFVAAGLAAVESARDLEDRERVTLGRLPAAAAGGG